MSRDEDKCRETLIAALIAYADTVPQSGLYGDDLEPINPGHPVHDAVVRYEKCFKDGMLPRKVRLLWTKLVEQSRDGDYSAFQTAEDMAEMLKAESLNVSSEPQTDRPRWDKDGRALIVGGVVVKQYKRHPAPNQVRILAAFEEEGWENRIDDPIPGGTNPKKRLRDTVQDLNKAQGAIKFSTDGTGEGVQWEPRTT